MNIFCSGKIARLIFLICLILVLPFHVFGDEINVRVSHGDDDAEETISDGDMYRGSSGLEMTWDGHEQAIGIRFENICIAQGSVITNAYIAFKANGSGTDETNLVIKGEDSDDADRFSNNDYDITGRSVTDALVSWDNVSPWDNNSYYQTPNLTSIIREIISRGGWASGNDMVFIVTGSGQRRADSYNGSSGDAPLLYIEYSETPIPYIDVNPASLEPFCYVGNNPASNTFTITNSGTVNLNYSLSDNQDWASCSPTSGVLSAGAAVSITVAYTVSSMEQGAYNAIITVEDNGSSPAAPNSPVEINITLEIQVPTVEVSVSAGSDDAEENAETGNMYLTSGDLELIHDNHDQKVGIRFQNITVPQGAMITNAYIEFDVDENVNTNPVNLDIYCEASDNPNTFTASDNNISDRARTTQFISWDNLPDWNNGEQHQTPDLRSVVQTITGRTGWSSGNAMVFIITGSGKRVAESYDGDGASPLLHIEYVEGSFPYISVDDNNIDAVTYGGSNAIDGSFSITNTGDEELSYTMALTMANGGDWIAVSGQAGTGVLAAGASAEHTITYATSALAAGNYNATITITGTNTPNSPYEIDVILTVFPLPEGATCGHVPLYAEDLINPAILVLLDVSSSMTSMMNVSSGVKPHTPDLTSIVQEIVNREGWNYENSMVFVITGTGHRTASSYDGNSGGAPLLHVEYNDGTAQEINIKVSQGIDDAEESSSGSVETTGSSDLELVYDGSNQTVGIRFQNIAIPKNATITNAYIEFEIDEQQDETTTLTIRGQAHDSPAEFTTENHNISSRTLTVSSVAWNNVEPWEVGARMSRIEIGKDVISELVKDRSIAWGYGTWCSKADDGYTSDIDYTKIHVGCRFNDDTQQAALQVAIADTVSHYGTPYDHSIEAAVKYFSGNKKDQKGAGEAYPSVECQPMFLIDITDGQGGTVANVAAATNALCDINVSPIAVGFGIDGVAQIEEMAKISNERGHDSSGLYALHDEIDGVGQPFHANNRQELENTLSTIAESIKAVVFHGSAPAATTSVDQGNLVIVAKFNAAKWSGELEALTRNTDTGEWDNVLWRASEKLPNSRNVFTINPFDDSDVILYSALGLLNDNYFDPVSDDHFCALSKGQNKLLGDFINSIPIIVEDPPFFYDFDGYKNFKPDRDPMIYIGANDGALHAFCLTDVTGETASHSAGEEKWAFVPLNLQDKLNRTDEPEYNTCGDEYCHQYFVDGSPQVGDIYADSEWKTILICGEREGGDAYFALDITTGNFDESDGQYLWEFRDTSSDYITDGIDNDSDGETDESDEIESDNKLGQTWSQVSIDRVDYGEENTIWGVFFGSGYSPNDQGNKQAYLYGIAAKDKTPLWNQGANDINRIKLSTSELLNDVPSSPLLADFDGDYISEKIYVGNRYGTMYRISDIGKDETPLITTLFDFDPSSSSPNINPISAKATYAYGIKTQTETKPIWIYYGTGVYNEQADKAILGMQYFFGLKDGLDLPSCYLYPFAGENPDPANSGVCGDLVELKAKYVTVSVTNNENENEEKEVRYIDGTCVENRSWVIKLYNGQADYNGPSNLLGSERVTKQPLVTGGIVFFTTFIPDPDICSGNGKTWVYAVDYKTGCAPKDPVFDLNGDNKFDDQDKIPNPDDPDNPYVPVAIPYDGGPGSKPVLGPGPNPELFITTPVEGVVPINVNMPDLNVQMKSWKESG